MVEGEIAALDIVKHLKEETLGGWMQQDVMELETEEAFAKKMLR